MLAQQLTTDALDTGLGGGEGEGRRRAPKGTTWGRASTQGIRAPRFSRPEFPTRILRGKGAFPPGGGGGVRRQHPPWCSRPAKVPVVRVLCRYKLGVRLGGCSSTSLQLTRLGGDCPPHPFSSLPQTSLGEGGAHGPGSPPATRGAIGSWWGAPLLTGALCTTQPPTLQPSETRLPPPLSSGPRRARSRGRRDPAHRAPPARRGTKAAWPSRARPRPRPGAGHGTRPQVAVAASPALLPPPSPARRGTGRNPAPRHGASKAVAASDRSLSPP